ncbi:histidine kinase [Agromyces tardus]|jgi:signal transduction histidine kinase|uniref:Histidine kinase n=1 Tax=Agromyces tardus TaxID=2583849 RepID=A0A3M7ZYM5_9MICO|nr:ATP-binding protein [Agromyces tardus]RNB44109.1 histidine kinase [Agromyces tardus]
MRRIHKERDRLLRRMCRAAALIGTAGTLACLAVPGSIDGTRFALVVVLDLAALALLVVHTNRGAPAPAVGAYAATLAILVVLATDPTLDPAASSALTATAALSAASLSFTVIVGERGPVLVALMAAGTLAAIAVASANGNDMLSESIFAFAGWGSCVAIAVWIVRAIDRAAERIDEVGHAHEAERLASEAEAQQRQDARVLHDTVLATLSLLAHSGVGVGASALRQQAGDDARLLKQLRLGAPLDRGSTAIFSPEPDEDALSTTFESVRQRFSRMGLDVKWHGAGQLVLPRETLDALLGALGECLENVRRHSGVREADVTISDDDHTVRAMVTDAGSGFEPDGIDSARLGFAESVVGRLHSVGGRARVFSSPGSGTTVMLEVPKP